MRPCIVVLAGLLMVFTTAGQASAVMRSYAGEYKGELWSSGTIAAATTMLQLDATQQPSGRYSFDDQGSVTTGVLDQCMFEADTLTCRWQDKYGDGTLRLKFSSDYCSFRGEWSATDSPDRKQLWNGAKPCAIPNSA